MRPLTADEMDIVAGGDGTSVTVTGTRGGDGGYYPIMPGGGGGGGGSGGGGGGIAHSGGAKAGQVHKTKNGNSYTPAINLTTTQTSNLDSIVDYGVSHGFSSQDIGVVVDQAYYESSLGQSEVNSSNSSVKGMFQYNSATWNYLGHGDLSLNSDADQITAMFQDVSQYHANYNNGVTTGDVPQNYSFSDYVEVQHHLGDNSENWTSPVVADYNNKSNTLGFNQQ